MKVRLLGLLAVCLLLAGSGWVWWITVSPEVPTIAATGLDPAVAGLIESSLSEVRAARRSAAAWGKLGSVLLHYEMVDEAHRCLAQAEALAPAEPRWPYLQGLLLSNVDPELARRKLARAVELCPEKPDAPRLRFAQFLAERGAAREADAQFDVLLRRQPPPAPAGLGRARLWFSENRFAEAQAALTAPLQDPHTAKSAAELEAALLRAMGDVTGANAAARRAAALPPDVPWPDPFWEETAQYRVGRKWWLEEAAGLADHGRPTEALDLLSRVAAEYPEDAEAWYLTGWLRNQQGQLREAESALREHLRRAPDSAKGQAQLAVALLAQRRYPDALAVLRTAVDLKPTWRELHSNLGFACVQLGRVEEAASHYHEALALDPNYLPTCIALAELALRRGDREEARRVLQHALTLDPDHAPAKALWQRASAP